MTKLKSIALELLQKYEESETSLIWEYSGDINKSVEKLDAEVAKYRELIDKYAEQEPKWISVSERLPEDLEPVNITWVNHNPENYYADIKDKPFTATGHYCNGRWWWYSTTCQDYLNEYGRCDVDAMDDDIEVIAWMPLPKPFEPQESEVRDE